MVKRSQTAVRRSILIETKYIARMNASRTCGKCNCHLIWISDRELPRMVFGMV